MSVKERLSEIHETQSIFNSETNYFEYEEFNSLYEELKESDLI